MQLTKYLSTVVSRLFAHHPHISGKGSESFFTAYRNGRFCAGDRVKIRGKHYPLRQAGNTQTHCYTDRTLGYSKTDIILPSGLRKIIASLEKNEPWEVKLKRF